MKQLDFTDPPSPRLRRARQASITDKPHILRHLSWLRCCMRFSRQRCIAFSERFAP